MNLTLKIKLASIVVHLEEFLSKDGHDFDRGALEGLVGDFEVQCFLEDMDPVYLPVKRNKDAGKTS